MLIISQAIILFVAGICAIIGCLFLIHVAARSAGDGNYINGAHAMTGLFVGWLFLTTAWCMARFAGFFG